MPRNLPVISALSLVAPTPQPRVEPSILMPSAILAARGRSVAPPRKSVSPPPRKGRPNKKEIAADLKSAIDERIRSLREESATRKEVMEYFESRIKELCD